MKKTKVLVASLIVATFGGLTLASCGETSSSIIDSVDSVISESSATSQATPVTRLQISTPTDDVLVGDVINLEQYVTMTGGDGSFTATLTTEDTAVLDGHTLTITGEGSVNVKIAAGTKTGRFNVTALSELRAKFKNDISKLGKNYYIDNLAISGNDIYLSDKGFIHNDNYFAICEDSEIWDDGDDSWFGYMKNGLGDTYEFEMADKDGKDLNVKPGKKTSLEYYFLNQDIPLDYSVFETREDSDGGEYLFTKDQTTVDNYINYCYGVLNTPVEAGYKYEGLEISYVQFKDNAGKTYDYLFVDILTWGFTNQGKTYTESNPALWFYGMLSLDAADSKVAPLDAYIASNEAPTPLKADEIPAKVKAIATGKQYALESNMYWSNQPGGTPCATEPDSSINNAGLPTEKVNTYVDGTTIYNKYEDGAITGVTEKDGKLYSFTNVDDKDAVTTTTTATEYSKPNATVWGGEFDSMLISSVDDESMYTGFNVTENSEKDGVRTIGFSGDSADAFILGEIGQIAGYSSSLTQFFSNTASDGSKFTSFFDCEVTIKEDELNVLLYIYWTAGYYWNIELTYTSFSESPVPSLESVVFPSETPAA